MEPILKVKEKRKAANGVATNELVHSACVGNNDDLFPQILSLYVAEGSTVADVTYGKGVFWRKVPQGTYNLLATDLKSKVNALALPYEPETIDCVVFDPPYMHTPGGSAHKDHQNYEDYYQNNAINSTKKYHDAVLDLYFQQAKETYRVLRNEGFYIVKCGDEVCANQQRLTHIEIINELNTYGFVTEDLFVLMRNNRPGVSRVLTQAHARKNHSFFIVFRKSNGKTRWKGVPNRPHIKRETPAELLLFPERTH